MREYTPDFGDKPEELPTLFPGGVPPEVDEQPDVTITRENLAEGKPEPVHLDYPIVAGEGRGRHNGRPPAEADAQVDATFPEPAPRAPHTTPEAWPTWGPQEPTGGSDPRAAEKAPPRTFSEQMRQAVREGGTIVTDDGLTLDLSGAEERVVRYPDLPNGTEIDRDTR